MRLDLIRPNAADVVQAAQQRQVDNAKGIIREVLPGDSVLFRDYGKNTAKWSKGTVLERNGAVTYKVQTNQGDQRKHIDQLIPHRKLVRYSWPMENTTLELESASAQEQGWVSAPSSPVPPPPPRARSPETLPTPPPAPEASAAADPHPNPASPSTSGEWVNTRPRGKQTT